MNQTTLVFYRAFGNPTATLLDKFVAWIDGGEHSHVEIVSYIKGTNVYTMGCHFGRGGVSKGYYNTLYDACDFVTVEHEGNLQMFFDGTEGQPYSIVGAARTRWNWLPETKGWCCSTWTAAYFNLKNYRLRKVRHVLQWAKEREFVIPPT